jgi:hypothetical protein
MHRLLDPALKHRPLRPEVELLERQARRARTASIRRRAAGVPSAGRR